MNEELIQLLTELEDYMDNKADADFVGDPGGFVANEEMKLQVRIQDALNKLK